MHASPFIQASLSTGRIAARPHFSVAAIMPQAPGSGKPPAGRIKLRRTA
jgi:hypothetical protein